MKFLIILILLATSMFSSCERGDSGTVRDGQDGFFLYIPSEEGLFNYTNLRNYLLAWENNEIIISDADVADLFNNFIGDDSLESLLFESFLRYTKNLSIKARTISHFERTRNNSAFANSLRNLYAANPVITGVSESGRQIIQHNFNNQLFDENINLFHFDEVSLFNDEMGMFLFDNDWEIMPIIDPDENEDFEAFYLMYGGGTNALTITFTRFSNLDEGDIETLYEEEYYNDLYRGEWQITELPLVGILANSGADRIIIAHGHGPDLITNAIDTATFNAYLYNRNERILYEVSIYMNFSPVNMHFSERNRIFNHLYFQLMFVFLRQDQ